jgi:hypothetical protein
MVKYIFILKSFKDIFSKCKIAAEFDISLDFEYKKYLTI